MIELYRSGLSLAKIAERIGFSEKTVFAKLNTDGFQLRTQHGERGDVSLRTQAVYWAAPVSSIVIASSTSGAISDSPFSFRR